MTAVESEPVGGEWPVYHNEKRRMCSSDVQKERLFVKGSGNSRDSNSLKLQIAALLWDLSAQQNPTEQWWKV